MAENFRKIQYNNTEFELTPVENLYPTIFNGEKVFMGLYKDRDGMYYELFFDSDNWEISEIPFQIKRLGTWL